MEQRTTTPSTTTTIIEDVENLLDDFYLLNKKPRNHIGNYYDKVRHGIDMERERIILEAHQMIKRINKKSEEWVTKTKELEADCYKSMDSMDNINTLCKKNDAFIEEISDKIASLKDELGQINLAVSNEMKSKLIERWVTKTHQKAKAEMVTFESSLINNKGAIFRPNGNPIAAFDFGVFQVGTHEQIESIRQLGDICTSDLLSSSSNFKQAKDLVKLCEFDSKTTKLVLKYRGTRDGFEGQTFHRLCDTIGPSLTVVKATTTGNIFGGFTEVSWADVGGDWKYKADNNAFIYSLINQEARPLQIQVTPGDENAIVCNNGYGPVFGGGNDLTISTNSNTRSGSNSNLGSSYKHPEYQLGTPKTKNFLAGSYQFSTEEVEVYQVFRK